MFHISPRLTDKPNQDYIAALKRVNVDATKRHDVIAAGIALGVIKYLAPAASTTLADAEQRYHSEVSPSLRMAVSDINEITPIPISQILEYTRIFYLSITCAACSELNGFTAVNGNFMDALYGMNRFIEGSTEVFLFENQRPIMQLAYDTTIYLKAGAKLAAPQH